MACAGEISKPRLTTFEGDNHIATTCLKNVQTQIISCSGFQSARTLGSSYENSRGQDVGLFLLWKEIHDKIFPEKAQKTPHRQEFNSRF